MFDLANAGHLGLALIACIIWFLKNADMKTKASYATGRASSSQGALVVDFGTQSLTYTIPLRFNGLFVIWKSWRILLLKVQRDSSITGLSGSSVLFVDGTREIGRVHVRDAHGGMDP